MRATGADASTSRDRRFYEFVREERMFCATLAHLLMQKGPNLHKFLELVNSKSNHTYDTHDLHDAEIYLEFTYLRDDWNRLGRGPVANVAKRDRISELLNRADLAPVSDRIQTIDSESKFNAFFMGKRGGQITNDISYPGRWSVEMLAKEFSGSVDTFRKLCMFKWAFNIKPDMVIELPEQPPLCVEAKLESREGQYPATDKERDLFKGIPRVQQIELQEFMFKHLLDRSCVTVMINRNGGEGGEVPQLSWRDVFSELSLDSSIPFVKKLTERNQHLKGHGAPI